MGEHDNALREIADARARMSELADELGRRANPELLKARAKELALEKKDELTQHAKELAAHKRDELKQQAKDKALYWKSQAKETAMRKSYEWTDQATHTPRGLGLLGAVLGAGVGSVLMRKAFKSRVEERRYGAYGYRGRDYGRVPVSYARDDRYSPLEGERAYGYSEASPAIPRSEYSAYPTATGSTGVGYGSDYSESEGDGGSIKDRAAGAVGSAKERVSGAAESVKERVHGATDTVRERVHGATDTVRERLHGATDTVRERASHLRERVPSRDELRNRTSDLYSRALNEQPLALALGAMALGMLAASLLPVTDKERQLIEPAKRKAQEGISQLGDQVSQRLEGSEEQEDTSMQASSSSSVGSSSSIPQLPPLDEVTKVH
jgi:vacuolar-type H+-ATPase subunit H